VAPLKTQLLLIADTHLRLGEGNRLTARIAAHLAAADAVLHAGDISDASILEALRDSAPHADVHAVAGNTDHRLELRELITLELGGSTVGLVHNSGSASGRGARLRRWFPDADLVVFGHSHLPWHEVNVRTCDNHTQHQVNPGSAMVRRRAPTCSVAEVLLSEGVVAHVQHIPVD
jgi:putative phosphoesterase